MTVARYTQLHDTPETAEIMRRPDAFVLLAQIGLRARKRDSTRMDGLQPGEALVGDYRTIGLTERRYRTAKATLEKYGLATFRATNRGTVATLGPPLVFVVVGVHDDGLTMPKTTPQRQASDGPATSNKKEDGKTERRKREERPAVEVFADMLAGEEFRRLDVPELRAAYADWCGHRRDIRKPQTAKAVEIDAKHMLALLDGEGVAGIVHRMQKAIGAGWRGWYFADVPQTTTSGAVASSSRAASNADPLAKIHASFTGVS